MLSATNFRRFKMSEEFTGKAKGGKALANKMTAEERKAKSTAMVEAKMMRASLPRAICGSEDKKLVFGDIELQCYVLDNNMRVLSMRSLQSGIGMSEGGGTGGARRIPSLMRRIAEKGIKIMGLDVRSDDPIKFILPSGIIGDGYDATILPDICAVLIEADRNGILSKKTYGHIVDRAALLQHGFATMGIIFLVDKATGYDDWKKAEDFGKIIELFVVKDMKPYLSKFPPDFYKEICRLRGVPYDPNSVKRPAYFGHLTNDIVYFRLAPGVWKEIKERAKKSTKVKSPHLHRFLTDDIGDPRLKEVITTNITAMKLSDNWEDFKNKLDRVLPAYGQTLSLQLDKNDQSLGIGL